MTRRRITAQRRAVDPFERTRIRMAIIRKLEHGPTLPDDLDAAMEENLYWILRNRQFLRKVELEETGVDRKWEPFVFRVHPELDPTKGVDEGWQRHAARTPRADSE